MKKTTITAALIASFILIGGCSTYNSYVPEWAQIGSTEVETEAPAGSEESTSTWWNPFSWW